MSCGLQMYFLVVILCPLLLWKCGNSLDISNSVEIRLDEVSCMLSCIQQGNGSNEEECSCEQQDWSTVQHLELPPLTILCKNETQLHYYIRFNETMTPVNFMLVIELQLHHGNSTDNNFFRTEIMEYKDIISLMNLQSDSQYKVLVYGVSVDDKNQAILYGPSEAYWEKTWPQSKVPLPVKELFLDKLELQDDKYQVTVKWTPAEDLSCFYDFVWFRLDEDMDYKQFEIHQPQIRQEICIDDLTYASNYSIAIMAKSSDWLLESGKQDLQFATPTCLAQHNSLDICPPSTPEGFEVIETFVGLLEDNTPIYDLELNWTKPELLPLYYTVNLITFVQSPNRTYPVLNVTGSSTSAHFLHVATGIQYQLYLTAWSSRGASNPPAHLHRETDLTGVMAAAAAAAIITYNNSSTTTGAGTASPPWSLRDTALVVLVPVLVLVGVGVLLVMMAVNKRRLKERVGKVCQTFTKLEQMNPHYLETVMINDLENNPLDKWELKPEQLNVQSVLGSGAFGLVRRGWLTIGDNVTEIAIKMLKDYPTGEEVRQFRQEIEIMKSVGFHPHIVSMLGCCTKSDQEIGPYLIVEYCARGDLQSYLRTAWEQITNQNFTTNYDNTEEDESLSTKEFANKLYDFDVDNDDVLKPTDLLSIARQVAMGMEYLSNLRVVHRDLAARNILVCADRTVKVSDFGLSRDVYQDNIYCKTGGGKLPVKWMALESLTHQHYTTQSDVWSFGVLLWEIVTLGGNPYPGIGTQSLLAFLKGGYRMDRPGNCNEELYLVMLNCWKASPKDRPTFTQLCTTFDRILESLTPYLHLDINNCTSFESVPLDKLTERSVSSFTDRYVRSNKCV